MTCFFCDVLEIMSKTRLPENRSCYPNVSGVCKDFRRITCLTSLTRSQELIVYYQKLLLQHSCNVVHMASALQTGTSLSWPSTVVVQRVSHSSHGPCGQYNKPPSQSGRVPRSGVGVSWTGWLPLFLSDKFDPRGEFSENRVVFNLVRFNAFWSFWRWRCVDWELSRDHGTCHQDFM